ncbi:class I SAM-dependent methyltransferase [Streptomyces sp. NPDC057363]|uniref:class I SAM-dependent methyltransferase n=1 Tax=Streptomyces sp. NPDC057363 TaxID=3346107 RepID=UPI00363FC0C0
MTTGRRVNPLLVEIASGLAPGTALDLGCGTGGDTLWLAGAGWRVTAVDVSGTVTAQVADTARERGLGDLVHTERHDPAVGFPEGRFDLVTALYLQSPFDLPRTQVLRTAARALAPGGRLLIVDHGSIAPWSWNQDHDASHPTPDEIAAGLALDPDGWSIERAASPRRIASGPDGRTAEVVDHVLRIRRTTV